MGTTLFANIWNSHVVTRRDDGSVLLYVDRHVVHDLASNYAFDGLRRAGRGVRAPGLTIATHDHLASSAIGRHDASYDKGTEFLAALRTNASAHKIGLYGLGHPRQGIVHVIAPELGIALPGVVLVCGDSHTCTDGGVGALAMGIGTSEVEHVLATQTLVARTPKTLRVTFTGTLPEHVTAKDLILHLIGAIGARGGSGYAIEYAGPVVRALPVEARLTLCNMSIECGARIGMVAPDDTTYDYLHGKPYAPRDAMWDRALAAWRTLPSTEDATFDREVTLDVSTLAPQVTWGTSPENVASVTDRIPDPAQQSDASRRESMTRALAYMGLTPGTPIANLRIDKAFIGSCTNSRISDLRAAAAILRGRHVAPHVQAMVVPGSSSVKRAAEAEGLDRVFRDAGFDWRESACSMCAGVNDDRVLPQERCISSSNRNFEGRQGPGARTHLASPVTVAASAIAGTIADVRTLTG
jgi:3-isopropylmalate/(R)-2-methylmalate dehydratase large subunit